MILQTIFIFLLTKSITQFLNRFQLEKANSKLVSAGTRAPLFREISDDGKWVKLSDFNQKYTIIFFAKYKCNICKKTLSTLNNIILNLPTSLRMIIVVPEEIEDNNLSYPSNDNNYLIRSESIIANYEVTEVPTIFLIDPNGIITKIYTNDDLEELKNDLGLTPNHFD
jgi:cytochrome oxidase Cu insertion factor (SCO1/SenC/PrrC family)